MRCSKITFIFLLLLTLGLLIQKRDGLSGEKELVVSNPRQVDSFNDSIENKIMSSREQGLKVACRIFIGVAYLFWTVGLIVVLLTLKGFANHLWQAGVFLIVGAIAFTITKFGLSSSYIWAWMALVILFIPWTLLGLINDARLRYWPLVAGETLGLVVIMVALILAFPAVFLTKI